MTELHKEFGADGLQIVALPSDQFGGQELATDTAVAEFAKANGPFPPHTVLTKGDVNGESARPAYQFVRAQTGMGDCKWYVLSPRCILFRPALSLLHG
jgi:glutathione peroxidase-family protein